jgi:hypothetical protein
MRMARTAIIITDRHSTDMNGNSRRLLKCPANLIL